MKNKLRILLFGATGRVGEAVTDILLKEGHDLTVFIRNKNKIKATNGQLKLIEGDIYNQAALNELADKKFEVVINVVGANPLKPSTLVTDSAKAITKVFNNSQIRYIAITGIAQMRKTFFGRITIALLKLTPVKHAIKDHQNAFQIIAASPLSWALVGCPYIKDGATMAKYHTAPVFPGGFKIIHPGDVAIALVNEISSGKKNAITGIWY